MKFFLYQESHLHQNFEEQSHQLQYFLLVFQFLFLPLNNLDQDYSRVRIGIGKPKENIEVGDFVLQNFDEDEILGIEKISNNINESISLLVDKKLDLFSSTVNNK